MKGFFLDTIIKFSNSMGTINYDAVLVYADGPVYKTIAEKRERSDGYEEVEPVVVPDETNIVLIKFRKYDDGAWLPSTMDVEELFLYIRGRGLFEVYVDRTSLTRDIKNINYYFIDDNELVKIVGEEGIEEWEKGEVFYTKIREDDEEKKVPLVTSVLEKKRENIEIIYIEPEDSVIITDSYLITAINTNILLLKDRKYNAYYLYKRGYGWSRITDIIEEYKPRYNLLQEKIAQQEIINYLRDEKNINIDIPGIPASLLDLTKEYHRMKYTVKEELEKKGVEALFPSVVIEYFDNEEYKNIEYKGGLYMEIKEAEPEGTVIDALIYDNDERIYDYYIETKRKLLIITEKARKVVAEYVNEDANKETNVIKEIIVEKLHDTHAVEIKALKKNSEENNVFDFRAYDLTKIIKI